MKDTQSGKIIPTKVRNAEIVKEKRRQIFKAASELFSEKGYHSTSMRDISEKSGINLSYLYQFIETKDDILYLFYMHMHEQWSDVFSVLADKKTDEDLIIRFKRFIETGFGTVKKMESAIRTMYSESRHLSAESLKVILARENRLTEELEQFIRRGVAAGIFNVPDVNATASIVQYLLVIHALRAWNFKEKDFDRFVEKTTDFILNGLGVSTKK
ncbi:MAG: TetR/AcrR family transcriptional regulator [Syntrophales bacterium]|nr:TetR/AcrR family transcriptional regulator [Syntrophales bacterium]